MGAGTLFLVFGTSAPSYIKTAFCKVRQTAKDSIDPRFEIKQARTEIASLQPAFDQNKEVLARARSPPIGSTRRSARSRPAWSIRRGRSWRCRPRSRRAIIA